MVSRHILIYSYFIYVWNHNGRRSRIQHTCPVMCRTNVVGRLFVFCLCTVCEWISTCFPVPILIYSLAVCSVYCVCLCTTFVRPKYFTSNKNKYNIIEMCLLTMIGSVRWHFWIPTYWYATAFPPPNVKRAIELNAGILFVFIQNKIITAEALIRSQHGEREKERTFEMSSLKEIIICSYRVYIYDIELVRMFCLCP